MTDLRMTDLIIMLRLEMEVRCKSLRVEVRCKSLREAQWCRNPECRYIALWHGQIIVLIIGEVVWLMDVAHSAPLRLPLSGHCQNLVRMIYKRNENNQQTPQFAASASI